MGELDSKYELVGVVINDDGTRPLDTSDDLETLVDIETYLKKMFDPESLQGQIIMSLFETTQHSAYRIGWKQGFKSRNKG